MAIDFTTNPGGFFPRLGRILHVAYLADTYEATLPAAFVDLENQFELSLQEVAAPVAITRDGLVRVASGVMAFATSMAQDLVVQTVLADQPSQASGNTPFLSAMREVIRQMTAQGVTVKANVVSLTPTQLTGSVGNGVLVTSTKRGDGLVNENIVAETVRITCSVDSYTGTAVQGRETFGFVGAPALAGTWDYDFPRGSGTPSTSQAVSADQDATASGNLTTNGDMEDWTTAVPADTLDNWTLSTGVWGTDAQKSTTANRGSFSLQFLPTGGNTAIYQQFNSSAGSTAQPSAITSYGVNLWLRKLSGTITAGVLTVELVDGTGTVTNDQQGVPNSFAVTLSTLTTSFVAYNSVFRINATPGTLRLRLRLSTGLAGASFLVDDVCFGNLHPGYAGGPGYVLFSGPTPFAGGDGWSVVAANAYGGASYLATFQSGADRLFDMKGNGLLLPSATPGTVSNALITA